MSLSFKNRKITADVLMLLLLSCSCTKYGHLQLVEGEQEAAKVVELDIKHNWGDPSSGLATYGWALYSENVRLVTELPFGSTESEPVSRFHESIEISEGDDVVIVIEYDERRLGVQDRDLHLYISVPEIVLGHSIKIDPDSNSISIGYERVTGLRYDFGVGNIEFVSSSDEGLEFVIDIEYQAFEPCASTMPDSLKPQDPLPVRIKGMIKARKDTTLRRLIGMRTSAHSLALDRSRSDYSTHG